MLFSIFNQHLFPITEFPLKETLAFGAEIYASSFIPYFVSRESASLFMTKFISFLVLGNRRSNIIFCLFMAFTGL